MTLVTYLSILSACCLRPASPLLCPQHPARGTRSASKCTSENGRSSYRRLGLSFPSCATRMTGLSVSEVALGDYGSKAVWERPSQALADANLLPGSDFGCGPRRDRAAGRITSPPAAARCSSAPWATGHPFLQTRPVRPELVPCTRRSRVGSFRVPGGGGPDFLCKWQHRAPGRVPALALCETARSCESPAGRWPAVGARPPVAAKSKDS